MDTLHQETLEEYFNLAMETCKAKYSHSDLAVMTDVGWKVRVSGVKLI